jgi:hypothetical protein
MKPMSRLSRFDVGPYDRSPVLTGLERARIAAVAAGESLHLRLDDPLTRLTNPLRACLCLTAAQPSQYSLLRHLVCEMDAQQTVFWAWQHSEWTSVYRRCKEAKTTSNTLQHVMAMAALLCSIDLPELRNQETKILRRYALAVKIFGREPVDRSVVLIHRELKRLGYTGYFHPEVRNALCELFLLQQAPQLDSSTAASLEFLRTQGCAHSLKQATFMISHALVGLGLMSRPLAPLSPSIARAYAKNDTMSLDWLSWCNRWYSSSTLRQSTRRSARSRLLVVGRWLQATHPEITSPDQWTRQLAAEHVAAAGQFRTGEFVDDKRTKYPDKLLSVSSRYSHISSLRCFFTDLLLWELIPYRFDPKQAFRYPRSLVLMRTPNPRIIAEDVWAKLLWAGLNLELSDLPRSKNLTNEAAGPRYPLALIRALTMVWLFAGLRKDEIGRLRTGCVRWQQPANPAESADGLSVCLMDVPANKTSGAYTKPVHRVAGEAIEEWQRLRPSMHGVTDDKTGEVFHVLFGYRGRPLGKTILNLSVIPMLCRKAGVPSKDTRGQITSHRARSTIATQLYNAKEPMSLLALKEWLGHRRLSSTQWYASVTPETLTQAYVDARYFERNVAVVQVLLDRSAIESGAAARGEPYKYVHLGHGYCSNPYWSQCQHRMACQRCDFYVPGESGRAQALEANAHNQRLMEQIPMTENERKALAGDQVALDKLITITSLPEHLA